MSSVKVRNEMGTGKRREQQENILGDTLRPTFQFLIYYLSSVCYVHERRGGRRWLREESWSRRDEDGEEIEVIVSNVTGRGRR